MQSGAYAAGSGSTTVRAGVAVAALLLAVFSAAPVEAIPTFSREHKTECTTCHTIFPQLNEFGQAFEKNGFAWPGKAKRTRTVSQTEQERKSAEYIALSGIPAVVPVSFMTNVSYLYDDTKEDHLDQKRFSALILTAGTLGGDRIGYWFHESLGNQSTTPSNSLSGPSNLFFVVRHPLGVPVDLKAGKFSPDLSLWKASLNGSLLSSGYDDGYSVTRAQNGLELSSIIGSRVQAVVGVNDRSNTTDAKAPAHSVNDYYGRVGVRFGGTDYHGVEPDVDLDKDSVWDFLSVSFSAFGYKGTTSKGDGVDRDLHRYGAQSEVAYKKFLLMAGYTVSERDQDDTATLESSAWSAEVDYIHSQRVALTLRYDSVDVDGKDRREVISPSVSYAPLQTFKVRLSVASDTNPGNSDTGKAEESTTATLSVTMCF